jgi:hypothetical protein
MSDEAAACIARMGRQNPQAVELARLLSFAVLVDPALIRAMRLALLPRADVGAEADLWFGPLVQTRNRDGIVLLPAVAETLRATLNDTLAERSFQITKCLHDYLPPAVQLEERLNFLSRDPAGNEGEIEELFQSALVALVTDRRAEVANWAGRALPRLSNAVRDSAGGHMLAAASDLRLGRSVAHASYLRGGALPGWIAQVLPDGFPTTQLGVRVVRRILILDPALQTEDAHITLPATEPCVLQVTEQIGGERRTQMVFVAAIAQSVALATDGPIEIATLAGQAFTIERVTGERPDSALVARAYANCNQVLIVWQMSEPAKGLLGFAVERIDARREETVLSNALRFSTPPESAQQPTTHAPVQRFIWMDRLSVHETYTYRITPVVGAPGKLELLQRLAVETNEVRVRAEMGGGITAVFNGPPNESLARAGTTPDDRAARETFGGDVRRALLSVLGTARDEGATVLAALFMLDDPELVEALAGFGDRARIVLSHNPLEVTRSERLRDARRRLGRAEVTVHKSKGFMHTNFLVICDRDGKAKTVWTGSLSWTTASLFAQDSNALIIEHPAIASRYQTQWRLLRTAELGAAMRNGNAEPMVTDIAEGVRVTLRFAPVPTGWDLAHVRAYIAGARSGILFSIGPQAGGASWLVSDMLEGQVDGPYVAGVARPSDDTTQVIVYQRGNKVTAQAERMPKDAFGIAGLHANAVSQPIGTRLIVIDPFGERPIVITGSHTFTRRASADNEEDLLIIEGHRGLAQACAVHIKGLIDHYAFRARLGKSRVRTTLVLRPDDSWLKSYMTEVRQRELGFWLGTLSAPPSPRGAKVPRGRATASTAPKTTASRPATKNPTKKPIKKPIKKPTIKAIGKTVKKKSAAKTSRKAPRRAAKMSPRKRKSVKKK